MFLCVGGPDCTAAFAPNDRAHHLRHRAVHCQVAALTVFEPSAGAQTARRSDSTNRFAKFIEEASGASSSGALDRAVMQVESGGDEHAISSRGAMGLMQLMPGTWVELSVRYGLGLDPFDAHDNIIAGAAYLKGCTIASERQDSLQPITRVRRGTNSTSRQADRFHRKPRLTLRRSRHCSMTSIANARQFASDVRFLGGKRRCFLNVPKCGDRYSPCFRNAETLHRNGSPLTRSGVNHLRSYRDDRKRILSYAASRSWKPTTRELGGDERPRRAR